MDRFRRALPGSVAYSLAGLFWGCLLGSVVWTLFFISTEGWQAEGLVLTVLGNVFGAYALALGLGLLLVPLIGIPAYALLRSREKDSYLTAGLVGLSPAVLVLLAFDNATAGGVFALFGMSVGFLTHFFASQARHQGHAL